MGWRGRASWVGGGALVGLAGAPKLRWQAGAAGEGNWVHIGVSVGGQQPWHLRSLPGSR